MNNEDLIELNKQNLERFREAIKILQPFNAVALIPKYDELDAVIIPFGNNNMLILKRVIDILCGVVDKIIDEHDLIHDYKNKMN